MEENDLTQQNKLLGKTFFWMFLGLLELQLSLGILILLDFLFLSSWRDILIFY